MAAPAVGESRALGEVLEQEALPVELVGRIDGACLLQQVQRRHLRGARGVHHGLVFGCVLVGLEQDLVKLLADRGRAVAVGQRLAHSAIWACTAFFFSMAASACCTISAGAFLKRPLPARRK
jgi:hypothetical protein